MSKEIYIPVSPNPYEEISQEDVFSKVFTPKMDSLDIKEEILPDNLYFFKAINQQMSKNSITFEDFDQFYKKFTDIEEMNEIENANYERPSFYVNFNQDKLFSSFENEKIVNVVNSETEVVIKCLKEGKIEKDEDNIKLNDCKIKEYVEDNDNKMNIENMEEKEEQEMKSFEYINSNNNLFTFEKPKAVKKKKPEDIYFPFTQGKGIYNSLKIYDESCSSPEHTVNNNTNHQSQESDNSIKEKGGESPVSNPQDNFDNTQNFTDKNSEDNNIDEENSIYTEQIVNGNEDYLFKFKTKKYFITENGKKRRIKKKRKFKSDDIRKKIKSRFHKTFKNIINENLKKSGSKKFFDFLPQCFIGDVSKKTNANCLELTYKELLLTDFSSELNKDNYPNKDIDYRKYLRNKEVIEYLEKNEEICRKSGFDLIKDKKYKDLLNIYFSSGEFEDSLIRLKKENESKEYIQEYVLRAKNYVKFYNKYRNKCNDKDEINDEDNF